MRALIIAALLMTSCAAINPYAYSGVMTLPECRAQCASYGLQPIGVIEGVCQCDSRTCLRPKRHGGCERLPPPPGASTPSPTTQM